MHARQDDNPRDAKRARVDFKLGGAARQNARISEQDAGMTEYVHPGWEPVQGIIKQRYADFLVHEIALGNEVLHVRSLAPPVGGTLWRRWVQDGAPGAGNVNVQEEEAALEVKCAAKEAELAATEQWTALQPYFGGDTQALEQLACGTGSASIMSVGIPDKADRAKVHQLIRSLSKSTLASEATTTEDGVAAILVQRMPPSRSRARLDPTSEAHTAPPYIHFTLQKTNRDSQEALLWLARFLRVDGRGRGANLFSVAGTKDKRAITVQRVAFQRGQKTLDDLWRAVNHIDLPVSSAAHTKERRTVKFATSTRAERGLRIAHLAYADRPLQLGMLAGNQFTIALRNVCWADKPLCDDRAKLCASLRERAFLIERDGYINYFGMQRFGTGAVATHAVGIAILRGDFQAALALILSPHEADSVHDGDEQGAPPNVVAVRKAKQAYAEARYGDAYDLFPKTCVAERAVLNKMRSKHWLPTDSLGAFQNIPRTLRLMYVHAYQSYLWNSMVSERVRRFGALHCVAGDLVATSDGHIVLDESNAQQYGIEQAVMPMPGSDVHLPSQSWLASMYTALLDRDGLTPASLSASRQAEYRLKGAHRAIIQKPRGVSVDLIPYTDADAPLVQTDEETLLPDVPAPVPAPLDAPFLALQLTFQLPPSSYATILLRELLHTDTSAHVQAALTKNSADQHS